MDFPRKPSGFDKADRLSDMTPPFLDGIHSTLLVMMHLLLKLLSRRGRDFHPL
jgi:hypothetical protein